MNWFEILTMTVAAVAAVECVIGRLAAMDRALHRRTWFAGYFGAMLVCVAAVYMTAQGQDASWLDWAAWGVAAHLAVSWGDWRHGPPLTAYKPRPARYRPGDLVPSSQFDDGRR